MLNLGKKYKKDSITYTEAGKDPELYCSTPYKIINGDFKFGNVIESWNNIHFGDTFTYDEKSGMKVHNPIYSKIRNRPFL